MVGTYKVKRRVTDGDVGSPTIQCTRLCRRNTEFTVTRHKDSEYWGFQMSTSTTTPCGGVEVEGTFLGTTGVTWDYEETPVERYSFGHWHRGWTDCQGVRNCDNLDDTNR